MAICSTLRSTEPVCQNGFPKGTAGDVKTSLHQLTERVNDFLGVSSEFFGSLVDPPVVDFASVGDVRLFVLGQPTSSGHPLQKWVSGLKPISQMGFLHSLFLFRKTLPVDGSPVQKVAEQFVKLTTPRPAPPTSFLKFVRKGVRNMFRRGWDSGYVRQVECLSLPVSSCLENRRGAGGLRQISRQNPDYHTRIVDAALGLRECYDFDRTAKVLCIRDGCKHRMVTSHSGDQVVLRPLHRLLYDRISHFPWLLRGDAKAKKFSDFKCVPGEVFVSGDYAAATDNLSLEVYEAVVESLAQSSEHVPSSVWRYALLSARHWIVAGSDSAIQEAGQLMGSFLSFPILCLINYLTFKFLVRRRVPVLINGDDIVFRCRPEEAEVWKAGVSHAGFVLSEGKTLVDPRFFTLNSALFRGTGSGGRGVPFIRPKALYSKPESLQALAGQFKAVCSGAPGERRRRLQVRFLVRWRHLILFSQRPVRQFLPDLPRVVLSLAGLEKRERFYQSLPSCPKLPTAFDKSAWISQPIKGVKSVRLDGLTRSEKKKAHDWSHSVVSPALAMVSRLALMKPWTTTDYWHSVRKGTTPYVPISLKPGLMRAAQRLISQLRSRGPGLREPEKGGSAITLVAPEHGGKVGLGGDSPTGLWWGEV